MDARSLPTHYIQTIDATSLQVRWLDMLALEVVVRGTALGSFSRRYGLEPGLLLPEPVVELFVKNDALDDPLINAHAAQVLGYADAHCLSILAQRALCCWHVVSTEFARADVRLLDIKFEFGLLNGELHLGDEIGFDTLRLCDLDSGRRLDKDVWYLREPGADAHLRELRERLRLWNAG
jgi:phosphoribosylaminoimidazole-succinocarboxamide synthase